MPSQRQIPDRSSRQPRAITQHAGERLGVEIVGGSPRRPLANRRHQGVEALRPRSGQRGSLPPLAGLDQRGRQFSAHRPGLVHHRAKHVKQQSVHVIRSDHAPIIAPATLPAFATEPTGDDSAPGVPGMRTSQIGQAAR